MILLFLDLLPQLLEPGSTWLAQRLGNVESDETNFSISFCLTKKSSLACSRFVKASLGFDQWED